MSTLPALVPFQVPQFSLGDTMAQMARFAALEQQRRASELETQATRDKLERDKLWRSTIAEAFPSATPANAPPSLNATPPQPAAPAPVTGGLGQPQPISQGPSTMGQPGMASQGPVGVPMDVNTQTGEWSLPGQGLAAQQGVPRNTVDPFGGVVTFAQPQGTAQTGLGAPQGAGGPQTGASLANAPTDQPGDSTAGLGTPQATRPVSASVPGLMPMPNGAAVQRAFAIDPEKTSQWYTAYLTQRGKQLDEVSRNNKLVYQVTSAMLENPDYYAEGLDYLREQGVPVPKNMPQQYNPALVQFHNDVSRTRLDPLQEAQRENQLAQTQLHKAQAADVPRRTDIDAARAGLQGMSQDAYAVIRQHGWTPASMTTEQWATVNKEVQDKKEAEKGAEGLAASRARTQGEVEARQNQTLAEAFKGETTNLYNTQTGQPLDARMKVKDFEALPAGGARQLSEDNRKQQENITNAMPRLQILQGHIDAVYGPGGVLERMSPADRELLRSPGKISTQVMDQWAQKYPELAAAQKYIEANAESLARALSGVRGAATEEDVNRAKAMLPNLTATLKVWPLSQLGFNLPDTRETALRTMNNLVDTLNGISGAILGNAQFAHPLHRYENPSNVPGPGLREGEGSFRLGPGASQPPSTPPPRPPQEGPYLGPSQQQGTPPPLPEVPGTRPALPGPYLGPSQQQAAPGRQSAAPTAPEQARVASWFSATQVMTQADIADAVRQTGRSPQEVVEAARRRGYRIEGSALA